MDRQQLIASLLAGEEDARGVAFEDDGRYIDWSSDSDDGVRMELGDDAEAAAIDLSWADMERLQRALTLRLLQRGQ